MIPPCNAPCAQQTESAAAPCMQPSRARSCGALRARITRRTPYNAPRGGAAGGLRDADATCDVHRCNMRRAPMQHATCMHQRRCKVQRCNVYNTQRATTQQTTDHPMQRATCIDATCKRQRLYKVQRCSLQHATCSHATKARPRDAMLPIHGPHGLVTVHEPRSRHHGVTTQPARASTGVGRGWRTAKPCTQQPRRH